MTWNCDEGQTPEPSDIKRRTDSSDAGLLADNHALKHAGTREVIQVFRCLGYTAVLQGVLSKDWIERRKSVADLVDRLGGGNEQARRVRGAGFWSRDRARLEKVPYLSPAQYCPTPGVHSPYRSN